MSWIAVAVIGGGALLGAGASIYGSRQTGKAMEGAARTQSDAAIYAANLAQQRWEQTREDQLPWLTAGTGALNQLAAGMAPGGQYASYPAFRAPRLTDDPGYQWRLQQGTAALDASAAAAGNPGSGNLGTALVTYGQNLGSQEYQNAYNRALGEYALGYGQQTDAYNRLAGLAGTGQTTATNLGTLGMNAATNQGNMLMGGANALAAGQIGSAQAQAAGITGVANQLTSGAGMYANYLQQQQAMAPYNQWLNFQRWNTWNMNTPYEQTYTGGSNDLWGY